LGILRNRIENGSCVLVNIFTGNLKRYGGIKFFLKNDNIKPVKEAKLAYDVDRDTAFKIFKESKKDLFLFTVRDEQYESEKGLFLLCEYETPNLKYAPAVILKENLPNNVEPGDEIECKLLDFFYDLEKYELEFISSNLD
jgi:hypothetical protein